MMKSAFTISCLTALCLVASAQLEIPGNPVVGPGKTSARKVGGGVDPGATLEKNPATTRYITHIIFHETRVWTSSEGKPLAAKIIAFEDLVAEVPKGSQEPKPPEPPARPTLIRDGKIRLMADGPKFFITAIDRFSSEDQEFIRQLQIALDKKVLQGIR